MGKRKYDKPSDTFVENLCLAVERRPYLWDIRNKGLKDAQLVANGWIQVARECDLEDRKYYIFKTCEYIVTISEFHSSLKFVG